jgi:hypothetical protein
LIGLENETFIAHHFMDKIFDSVLGFTLILHAQVFFSIVAKENSDFDFASFVVLS